MLIVHARLDCSTLLERAELAEVESKGGEDHFDAYAFYRGDQYVSGVEYPLDHGIVPFTRRSLFADAAISQRITNADGMIPSASSHCC